MSRFDLDILGVLCVTTISSLILSSPNNSLQNILSEFDEFPTRCKTSSQSIPDRAACSYLLPASALRCSNRFQQVPTISVLVLPNLPMCGFNLFHLVSTPRHCFQPFSNTSDRWPNAYRRVSCHSHKDLPASHGNELCDKRYGPHWQRSPQLHTQTCVGMIYICVCVGIYTYIPQHIYI